jgi:putative transcriptional regulator
MTQLQLAEKAGVRQATISELETGKTRRVDLDVLDRLCDALGVEPGDLLEREAKRRGKGK